MENVIGLAGGSSKVQTILGALHGRYIKILITDENTSESLINLEQRSAS